MPYGTRSTTSVFALALCRYHFRSGRSGVEQTPGHGAGSRFHGRKTLYPCVGFCSGFGGFTFAFVCLPASGRTETSLDLSFAACDGVATIR